ncbi:hypothetical protein OXT66_08480 [Lentilactobacillus senioris]|uniref:hypothetical protein n=1 Tax=Lentilactobacillus senioris TaxID=931534 RepID=UPI00227DE83A|nr:hypothetical protein [Lentilactobacillus senioris]MCY9807569.1 hypothetical protein [Lentilactobacillus senioris]
MIDEQNQRIFAVMVSPETVNRVARFYQQFDLLRPTVDFIIDRYSDDPDVIKSLVDGYEEMANLNQEITAEFTNSEEDAELVLTQLRTKTINFLG